MAKTVGDFVVERLRAWGVQRVFGYPGDGINGIMAGFEHAGDEGPRFIQARHEELSAFMAGAHAKFTGEPGVCLATSGPGAIHLLNGLYDAGMDHHPVVAIAGQAATTALGGDYQQEVVLLGATDSWELMSGCDAVLMVGSSCPCSECLPKEGQARGVQIDLKARMLGIRYPMEVHLHGDAAETLRALSPYLERKATRSW